MVVITEGWGRWDDGIREYNADERGGEEWGVRGPRGDAQCFCITIFGKGGKSDQFSSFTPNPRRFYGCFKVASPLQMQ